MESSSNQLPSQFRGGTRVGGEARHLQRHLPVRIFGAGSFGTAVCQALQEDGFDVAGFIETQPRTSTVHGLPVHSWSEVPIDGVPAQIVVGIFNRDTPFDQLSALARSHGFDDLFLPTDVYDQHGQALGWRFWLSDRELLQSHIERVSAVRAVLSDEESRRTITRLLAFRMGQDLPFASFRAAEEQYFNELTLPALAHADFTYVDCGAYNGDTMAALLATPGVRCSRAYLLEPDPGNFRKLVGNAARFKPVVVCLPLAAADRYTILSFASEQGEGSRVGSSGNMHVAAVALDDLLPTEKVGLLKLDVEGAEAQALKGAKRLIERCRPVLAVSLYHNPQDLWELPELIFSMCDRYRFHVRQHRYNSFESVLYAVPA